MQLPDLLIEHEFKPGEEQRVRVKFGQLVALEDEFRLDSAFDALAKPSARQLAFLAWHGSGQPGKDFESWMVQLESLKFDRDDDDEDADSESASASSADAEGPLVAV